MRPPFYKIFCRNVRLILYRNADLDENLPESNGNITCLSFTESEVANSSRVQLLKSAKLINLQNQDQDQGLSEYKLYFRKNILKEKFFFIYIQQKSTRLQYL